MKIQYKQYTITSRLSCGTNPVSDVWDGDKMLHYKHIIRIKNNETDVAKTFSFYGSHQDYLDGKTELTEYDLGNAFHCVIQDALDALQYSLDDFASEMDYDKPSVALKVYRSMGRTLNKVQNLDFTENDMLEVVNNEKYQ